MTGPRVEVLCRSDHADQLRTVLLRHTTTLGVREQTVTRYSIQRRVETIETKYGPVRIKLANLPDGSVKIAPEHDDCSDRAVEHGVSVSEVWMAALQAFRQDYS